MREIGVAIQYGNRRKHNETAVQGRFHGFDIPFKESPVKKTEVKLTKEQEKMADDIISERFKAVERK